jgi:hypothetical protein
LKEVEQMKNFKVVDIYEGRDLLGYADTMQEVKKLAKQRVNDTDSECLIEVRELDTNINKYKFLKVLETC